MCVSQSSQELLCAQWITVNGASSLHIVYFQDASDTSDTRTCVQAYINFLGAATGVSTFKVTLSHPKLITLPHGLLYVLLQKASEVFSGAAYRKT